MNKGRSAGTHKARVLVVDDQADVRHVLAREIGDRGHAVVTVADGARAVEEMERGNFDLVFADVKIPGTDGMDLAAWIKRKRPDTDVIVMTAHGALDSAAGAIRSGAFDHLLKPLEEADLVASTLDRAVQKRALEKELQSSMKQLEASRASFRSVVEKNSDGVVIVDRRGKVRFANPAAGALLSREEEGLVGRSFGFPVAVGETTEHEIIGADGERRVTEMRVVETDWEEETAYLASLRDITERKRTAEDLERINRELEEASRTKTEFTAAVSHELRTPLQLIIGYTDVILRDMLGRVTNKQREGLETVRRYSGQLMTVIDNVLALTRMEGGRLTLEVSIARLEDMLDRIRIYGERLDPDHRLDLLFKVPEDLPPITTDQVKLEEILQNLIGNAYKFTREGRIEVRIRDLKEEGRLEFSVADTGSGIEQSELETIFKPFHQGKEAHMGENHGVGLGLALAKRFIELMQGRIRVESQPGVGTTFTFTLPHSI